MASSYPNPERLARQRTGTVWKKNLKVETSATVPPLVILREQSDRRIS